MAPAAVYGDMSVNILPKGFRAQAHIAKNSPSGIRQLTWLVARPMPRRIV